MEWGEEEAAEEGGKNTRMDEPEPDGVGWESFGADILTKNGTVVCVMLLDER